MICAFMFPSTLMFFLSQTGQKPIRFPYIQMIQATLVAVALAVGYHFAHPGGELIQLPFIAAVMILWFVLLFALRIIPVHHWSPLKHIVMSALGRRSALQLKRRKGLRSIDAAGRSELRTAVTDRLPDETLVPAFADDSSDGQGNAPSWMVHPESEGARLVGLMRSVGRKGGIPMEGKSEVDAGISLFLFSNQPVAVRLRRMRQLMATGVDAHDLRTLEDLRNDLARLNDTTWNLEPRKRFGRTKNRRSGKGGGRKLGIPKRA
jgi:hypothetical protein